MLSRQVIGGALIAGIVLGVAIDSYNLSHPETFESHFVYEAKAEEPEVVLIETKIDWTEDRIIRAIQETFPEQPELMTKVAKCESQFKADAHNPTNGSHDGGIFQISQKHHGKELEKLNLDPYDVEDNLTYARILYEKNGLSDWRASKFCWNK